MNLFFSPIRFFVIQPHIYFFHGLQEQQKQLSLNYNICQTIMIRKIMTNTMAALIHKRSLIKPNIHLFSSSFPYNFGGISFSEPNDRSEWKVTLCEQLFGDAIKQQLTLAYKSVIEAIHEKDIQFLKDILEPGLTKSIEENMMDTNLINQSSDIDVLFGSINMVLFMPFVRGNLSDFFMQRRSVNKQYGFGAFKVMTDKHQRLEETNNSLFILEVYFRSRMKLIQQSQTEQIQNTEQEYHMLQFQLSSPFKKQVIIRQMWDIIKRNLQFSFRQPLKPEAWEQMVRVMVGINNKNYQWKIGDIDGALNGNLPKLIQ